MRAGICAEKYEMKGRSAPLFWKKQSTYFFFKTVFSF